MYHNHTFIESRVLWQ